jgi:hypothetical protein
MASDLTKRHGETWLLKVVTSTICSQKQGIYRSKKGFDKDLSSEMVPECLSSLVGLKPTRGYQ